MMELPPSVSVGLLIRGIQNGQGWASASKSWNHDYVPWWKHHSLYIQTGWDFAAERKHSSMVLLVTCTTSTSLHPLCPSVKQTVINNNQSSQQIILVEQWRDRGYQGGQIWERKQRHLETHRLVRHKLRDTQRKSWHEPEHLAGSGLREDSIGFRVETLRF